MTKDKAATNGRDAEWDRSAGSSGIDDHEHSATPQDVAGLYSWAKLEGSKYRDFSALRKKSRADSKSRQGEETAQPGEGVTEKVPEAAAVRVAAIARSRGGADAPGPRRLPTQRERQASPPDGQARWVAIRNGLSDEDHQGGHDRPLETPAFAFVSLAGGVGKTSLVASLGCLLAMGGQSTLLVDTHVYGLLPIFFGARELPPGTARTFANGSNQVPLRVMTLRVPTLENGLAEQVGQHADGMQRVFLDISTASVTLLRQALRLPATVIVVVTPQMASVVSLHALHGLLRQMEEETGRTIEVYFVLNQFDPSSRMQVEVRERLKRQLGGRFLPFAIRYSSAMGEALAEGKTVVDHAPGSQTVEDLGELAEWIRELDEPAVAEISGLRWRGR